VARKFIFERDPMTRLIFGVGAIILSVAYFAEPGAAQDGSNLVGAWELTMEAPQGAGGGRGRGRLGAFGGGTQTLMLSVQGEALQGALKAERGTTELKSILLDGNKITFTLAVEGPRGTFQLIYNGEVDGDTMTGTMEGPGGRFTTTWKATRGT
tara:strand:- start:18 stop:479 length:462 start_codon:yes stop_codon:yes gene_type:complete